MITVPQPATQIPKALEYDPPLQLESQFYLPLREGDLCERVGRGATTTRVWHQNQWGMVLNELSERQKTGYRLYAHEFSRAEHATYLYYCRVGN